MSEVRNGHIICVHRHLVDVISPIIPPARLSGPRAVNCNPIRYTKTGSWTRQLKVDQGTSRVVNFIVSFLSELSRTARTVHTWLRRRLCRKAVPFARQLLLAVETPQLMLAPD